MSRLFTPLMPRDSVAAGDVDGDGRPDLLVAGGPGETRLLRNQGELRFADEVLPIADATFAVALADLDDDGDLDAVVAGATSVRLFRNTGGGALVDQSLAAGLASLSLPASTTLLVHISVADLDGDGRLDLFVSNYFEGPSLFLRQLPDGRFEDAGDAVGLAAPGHSWASLPLDVDGDGALELYVANDTFRIDSGQRPRPLPPAPLPPADGLDRKEGDTFVDVAAAAGLDAPRSSMGAVFADLTGDGIPDLYVTDYGKNDLLAGRGDGTFTEVLDAPWLPFRDDPQCAESACPGLEKPRHCWLVSWAVVYEDFDLDGLRDLLVTNAHIESHPVQPTSAWRGTTTGLEPVRSGVGWTSARAAAVADLDGDGDLDLVLAGHTGRLRLYENQAR